MQALPVLYAERWESQASEQPSTSALIPLNHFVGETTVPNSTKPNEAAGVTNEPPCTLVDADSLQGAIASGAGGSGDLKPSKGINGMTNLAIDNANVVPGLGGLLPHKFLEDESIWTPTEKEIPKTEQKISSVPVAYAPNSAPQCALCNLTFTGPEPYKQHIAGARHRKAVKRLTDSGYDPSASNTTADSHWQPSPVQAVSTFGQAMEYLSHLPHQTTPACVPAAGFAQGESQYVSEVPTNSVPGITASNVAPQVPALRNTMERHSCECCNFECHSLDAFAMHVSSRNHSLRMLGLGGTDPSSVPAGTSSVSRHRCDTCAVECDTFDVLLVHLNSVKHAKKLLLNSRARNSQWKCDICRTAMTGEDSYNAHMNGKQHASMVKRVGQSTP